MLDTRSGRLLASQSFEHTFSEIQFAEGGLSYLLHQSTNTERTQEAIELHHLDLSTRVSRLVTRFTHHNHYKIRPSQWRGSISSDGSVFAYQEDVLQPCVTIIDGKQGTTLCRISWTGNLTALPAFLHPRNELIVIPLAQWDGNYRYTPSRKLLVANPRSGQVLGEYDVPHYISQVRFHENSLTLVGSNINEVGELTQGSPTIGWKPRGSAEPGRNYYLHKNESTVGFFSRLGNEETGQFQLLDGSGASKVCFNLAKGFVPVGLKDQVLINEKYIARELPTWMHKINERCLLLFGRYLLSSYTYALQYQNAATGHLLTEVRLEQRTADEWMKRRIPGLTRLAVIGPENDELRVEFHEVFPFWTLKSITLLAVLLTLLQCGGRLALNRLTYLFPSARHR